MSVCSEIEMCMCVPTRVCWVGGQGAGAKGGGGREGEGRGMGKGDVVRRLQAEAARGHDQGAQHLAGRSSQELHSQHASRVAHNQPSQGVADERDAVDAPGRPSMGRPRRMASQGCCDSLGQTVAAHVHALCARRRRRSRSCWTSRARACR